MTNRMWRQTIRYYHYHASASDSMFLLRHCALYKFTYSLTYLSLRVLENFYNVAHGIMHLLYKSALSPVWMRLYSAAETEIVHHERKGMHLTPMFASVADCMRAMYMSACCTARLSVR